jgi:hypothetical protein
MSKPYFRQLPNFDYISRLSGAKISDYIQVKNLFKKAKLREDIFENLSFFTKYKIIGDDRPDNVAYEIYDDSTLDWLILLSNNIINVQTEWPLPQQSFDNHLLDKYGSYDILYNGIHHYETTEVKNSAGTIIVRSGLQVSSDYNVSYYDYFTDSQLLASNPIREITNYEYEETIENNKRNIFILKGSYIHLIFDDLDDIMPYKKGSTQYVSETLKRGDNIRLYS